MYLFTFTSNDFSVSVVLYRFGSDKHENSLFGHSNLLNLKLLQELVSGICPVHNIAFIGLEHMPLLLDRI